MSFDLPSAQTANIFTGIAGVVTGIGQLIGAKKEGDLGDYNAAIDEQRARTERESFRLYEIQKRKTIKSQIGTQIATTGASGFKFTGDPINLMVESLSNAEFDLAIDKYNSEVKARGFINDAAMERYEAKARAARGYAGASSTFLSTAADMYGSQATGGKTEKLGQAKPMKPTSVKSFKPY